MLGFSIPGQSITDNVPVTTGSMVIAVAVVGVGLFIAGFGNGDPRRLVGCGLIVGLGVATMHYMGTWAWMSFPRRQRRHGRRASTARRR